MTVSEFITLVDDFGNAALKAGKSNSGYVIDVGASVHWERMQVLRKQLIAVAPAVERKSADSVDSPPQNTLPENAFSDEEIAREAKDDFIRWLDDHEGYVDGMAVEDWDIPFQQIILTAIQKAKAVAPSVVAGVEEKKCCLCDFPATAHCCPTNITTQFKPRDLGEPRGEFPAAHVRQNDLGVSPTVAVKILAARDALTNYPHDKLAEAAQEAYHQLYSIADPTFIKRDPFAELERIAGEITSVGQPSENHLVAPVSENPSSPSSEVADDKKASEEKEADVNADRPPKQKSQL